MPKTPPRNKIRDLLVPTSARTGASPVSPRDKTAVDIAAAPRQTAATYELLNAVPEIRRVLSSGPGYNVAEDPYGNVFRAEGAIPWRSNNPGNIRAGTFAQAHGGIGKSQGFAVFPSQEAGSEALRTLLFQPESKYRNLPVSAAIDSFAPKADKNDTDAYKRFVASQVGTNAPLTQLTPDQREAMLNAIKQYEGYYRGGDISMGGKRWTSKPQRQTGDE